MSKGVYPCQGDQYWPIKFFLLNPFYTNWFCRNNNYWAYNQYFEMIMWILSTISLVFAWSHKLEVPSIPATCLELFYVSNYSWWGRIETLRHFLLHTPPVFSFYSQFSNSSVLVMEVVLSVAIIEFIFMTLVSFFAVVRNGCIFERLRIGLKFIKTRFSSSFLLIFMNELVFLCVDQAETEEF